MIMPLGRYQEWSRKVIGKKLSGVSGLIYFFEAPNIEHPQQIKLIFSNAENFVSLICGKDGSTLELTERPIQEKDLAEYGKEIIMDLSDLPSLTQCIGKNLLKMHSLFSLAEDAYIGIKFTFEGEQNLVIANIGDELNILESFPPSYEQDEGIKYQEL